MNHPEFPRNIRRYAAVQQVGQEMLVYDERRHMAFCLNESSSIVFRLADGAHTVSEISAAASVELSASISEELVLFALEELRRDGLIESSSDTVGSSSGGADVPRLSRRAMVQRLGVGGAMLLPAIFAIVAPTAAQAYSGCVDCSVATPRRQRRTGGGLP
jgi:hypothetical protein